MGWSKCFWRAMSRRSVIFIFFVGLFGAVLPAEAAEYVIYSDAGIPSDTEIYTWPGPPETPIFDAEFPGLLPPEGALCFKTCYNSWAGWGIFYTDGVCDLSAYSSWDLTFWVKTNTNLKVEIKDINTASAKHISAYAWDGTDAWQKITIPIGEFASNLAQMESPFMITMDQPPYGSFFIDDVKWVEAGNHDPVITSVPVRRTIAEELYQYDVQATDYDGDTLSYLLIEQPPTMSIDSQTGLIQWTPTLEDLGLHSVTVKVLDVNGAYALQPYSLEVISADTTLFQIGLPYIQYFLDRALDETTEFNGLTRSFQMDLGGHTPADQKFIDYGAVSYDQAILGRICLDNQMSTILDTYVQHLESLNNPLMKRDDDFYDANGDPIINGPFRMIRILGHDEPDWWLEWDWILDTGAGACLALYAAEAYQNSQNGDYLNLAILFGEYLLSLQDTDGGIRYGPIGMYHPETPDTLDYYWHLKSTEQNERALYALQGLYQITNSARYSEAADEIKAWLKGMYNFEVHLYHSAAHFVEDEWLKSPLGTDDSYIATDVMAFAPVELMFEDPFFGSTQQQRDAEVTAMFAAIEQQTAFLDYQNIPLFFRFSVSQDTDDYGSVEVSSQMALAYLRVAQIYQQCGDEEKAQEYQNKYDMLILSLEDFFIAPPEAPNARVAPYASYFPDASVAAGVATGTGYYTYNCQAALASCYFVFAKAGYDPTKLSAGTTSNYILNMTEVPWYALEAPYDSTAAAVAQMILNYIREGAGALLLAQDEVYEYARDPQPYGPELNPDEVDKALGHFDPYDYLVSNDYDTYDDLPGGNPYQGYNFMVDTCDPGINPEAANEYLRNICHWMAYTVTEEGWQDEVLVARPHTPAAIPIYGAYYRWIVIKGCATSENPCPEPHTDPWNTPDFTVYGLWVKDPFVSGLGRNSYKTAAECLGTYFLPVFTGDDYDGKFLQVAEPPAEESQASVEIAVPLEDLANLEFIGVTRKSENGDRFSRRKQSWRDIVDANLLADPEAQAAFDRTEQGKPALVKRPDKEDANYYLVPFGKCDKKRRFLTSAVVILDANKGHFKEASWTDSPEVLLKVGRKEAIQLARRFILKQFKKLPRHLREAQAELLWQPGRYSPSPYKPYWKVELNGYILYVTQQGRVFPELNLR